MVEVVLVLLAVGTGLAAVMRMDVTPRAERPPSRETPAPPPE